MSSAGSIRMLLLGMFELLCMILNVGIDSANMQCSLEERRKVKGAAYYERKRQARKQLAEAQKNASVPENTKKQLEQYGY